MKRTLISTAAFSRLASAVFARRYRAAKTARPPGSQASLTAAGDCADRTLRRPLANLQGRFQTQLEGAGEAARAVVGQQLRKDRHAR